MVFNKTRNIGDDIQSYVAMKYLPKVDYYIDRENIDNFVPDCNEQVAVIMNGWYIHNTINWPPSPYIKPLPISMHFTTRDFWNIKEANHLEGYGLEYLKSISPIGCRDSHTLELLSEKGVKTEYTGCLTLTLNQFENVKKEDYICAVDVSKKVLEKIKEKTNLEIKEITHEMPEDYYTVPWNERVRRVEELLKVYQGAKCVLTTRLHVALPCIALNTPVLIIHDKYNDDRFKDYLEYIDYCVESDFLNGTYEYDFTNPPADKVGHIKVREDLNNRCKNFIKECEENKEENEMLPDINFYSKYVINKSNWLKGIALKIDEKNKNLDDMLLKLKEDIVEKNNIINILKNEVENVNIKLYEKLIELDNTKYNLSHIETSKAWRICKKLYRLRDNIVGNK